MSPRASKIVLPLLVVAAGLVAAAWFYPGTHGNRHAPLTLYGNVDIRQVQVAFEDSGRILSLAVDEGATVRQGQLLAQLDPARFRDAATQAQAQAAYQEQVLARLMAGSRPEEIRAAEAELSAAQATFDNAVTTLARLRTLESRHFIPKQSLDNAAAAEQTARANREKATQALRLTREGPRKEDIAAAQQALQAARAAASLAQRQLADTRLLAPAEGVVQDRIMEPGDMTSPQTPVFSLALDNPVWVRAYLAETDMGRITTGMGAWVTTDAYPGQRFHGWVGFISPSAEFTPKNVETPELRTELMYRVRIFVCNPEHRLRLGMPATVTLISSETASPPGPASCTASH